MMADDNAPNPAPAPAPVPAPAPAPVPAPAPAPAPVPAPAPAPVPAPAPAPIPEYTLADETGTVDETSLGEMAQHLRAAGLDGQAAQQRVSEFANAVKTVNARRAEAAAKQAEAALRADPEFGGDNFDRTMASAREAVEVLGGEELLAELDATGLGNSVGLLKALAKLAQSGVIKGKFVAGGTATDGEKSIADMLYGGSK